MSAPNEPVVAPKGLVRPQHAVLNQTPEISWTGAIVAAIVGPIVGIVGVLVGAPLLPLAIATGVAIGALILLSLRDGGRDDAAPKP